MKHGESEKQMLIKFFVCFLLWFAMFGMVYWMLRMDDINELLY